MDIHRGRSLLSGAKLAVLIFLGLNVMTSSLFFAQTMDQQPTTDQTQAELAVYDYISRMDITPVIKDLTRKCAQLEFNPAPYTRHRTEPTLFLAFLTILNTDSRLGITEKTATMQKISPYCDINSPSLHWLFSTVYEFLSAPTFDSSKLRDLMDARRQTQIDTMGVLQKVGIFLGTPFPNVLLPLGVDPLLRDIPVGQISQGLELYVLGVSSASSAKEAAMQAIRANLPIPQQRPNSPAGPQLDPGSLAIITAKVDSVDASEWIRVVQNICQRLRQLGQPVVKCN
ncbi:hypothetical protein HYR54_01010 [Candidatus Acetothermia bacterium]|nr:hypothetical protein [Candidatus Acetothermia bacterium]